ncbi:bifunctional ADP-dependent NAD(P)H-hydrate dehydratase/NAD(P)H-hydrate epimerase [Cellulosimicrobium sp. Marseille-Q4280]|uniref:bifunctional ADP-dependent NAD(P)H-hydrate dehydratase/NAD(P)H-hydrate epimerase n=1 Tax=Cellulosimicrobium sp. Marseille-Q4280 TaxID=2937992 RepID=UPI00203BBDEC|nr:bifunctional ADP-dependent NAD(P)H-hydrate dehydratase/NAD(P)H-hydrate epimerase [Cellulosimicrobium sp. Marseille-Q4280]
MIEAWSVDDVRAAEQPLLEAGVPLMERAAFALATVVARDVARARSVVGPDGGRRDGRVTGARVVLLVGSGNNGGDTLFAGAHLARRGALVTAVLTSERVHREGLAALRRAGGTARDVPGRVPGDVLGPVVDEVLRADAVLDGLVGIGATGALRGVAGELVGRLSDALAAAPRRPRVVAVDAPSGIGVDDGTVPGPVLRADRTVTFGAAKPGLLLPPATLEVGHGAVVDLGLTLGASAGPTASGTAAGPRGVPTVRRLEPADVAALWPVPGPTDHKYTRGVLGVVAGTPTYPGAAVLVSTAAVRTGPGMVRYAGPDDVTRAVLAARPEVVPGEGRVQAWSLGPGVPAAPGPGDDPVDDGGQHDRIRRALAAATGQDAEPSADEQPGNASPTDERPDAGPGGRRPGDAPRPRVAAVVDAGALSLLPGRCPASVVLTPHAGELATLLSARGQDVARADVDAEPWRWARRAHELTGATVLLKGSATVVVGPGVTYSQADAPSWLATAGAGDVLSGILGVLLAAHLDRVLAEPALAAELAAAAALVHGLAAERANPGGPVAALDVADQVPHVVAELLAAR